MLVLDFRRQRWRLRFPRACLQRGYLARQGACCALCRIDPGWNDHVSM